MVTINGKIYIGTSGWSYKDWSGRFYPLGLKSADWLKFYCQNFNTVEVNSSFYHQVTASIYERWKKTASSQFIFSVKMSRYLTHIKRLHSPENSWKFFIESAKHLKNKLGPILFQLPPTLVADEKRLLDLLKLIPKKYKLAFEFREPSWFNDSIYDILKKYNASLVIGDSPAWPQKEILTADFLYIRMHGPGGLYSSKYKLKDLQSWAKKFERWQKETREIYIYFNNDSKAFAIQNALELKKLLHL